MKKIVMMCLAAAVSFTARGQYAVGDAIEYDGIKSIIIKVDETGNHGLLMSLPQISYDKDSKRRNAEDKAKYGKEYKKILADRKEHLEKIADKLGPNGLKNAETVEQYCNDRNISMEDIFPRFAWAKSLGSGGWYIPGQDELEYYSYVVGFGLGKDAYKGIKVKEIYQKREELAKTIVNNGMAPDEINRQYEKSKNLSDKMSKIAMFGKKKVQERGAEQANDMAISTYAVWYFSYIWSSTYDSETLYPLCFGLMQKGALGSYYVMITNWSSSANVCAVHEF